MIKKATIFLILISSGISCGIDERQLTSEEKYTVDTLFGNKMNDLRIYADSLCKVERDTLFVRYADSIKAERIKEIEALLILNSEQQ